MRDVSSVMREWPLEAFPDGDQRWVLCGEGEWAIEKRPDGRWGVSFKEGDDRQWLTDNTEPGQPRMAFSSVHAALTYIFAGGAPSPQWRVCDLPDRGWSVWSEEAGRHIPLGAPTGLAQALVEASRMVREDWGRGPVWIPDGESWVAW